MASTTSGPYARESKADAWLFEHSKFLRKHFSPDGPSEIPSKHDLVQKRASGDAFPRETKLDTALFEHSKFLRNHVKHEENVDGGVKSKSAMLRESFDEHRQRATIEAAATEGAQPRKTGLHKTMRSNLSDSTMPQTEDYARTPSADPTTPATTAPIVDAAAAPAWQVATDNERAYGDEASLRSAAAVGAEPGLIEHQPTTMESTPIVGRPVPHSLQSNSAHARVYDEANGMDAITAVPQEDPMAR